MMIIGFTGTRRGMTERQARNFVFITDNYLIDWFIHGDCLGADAQAHNIIRNIHKETKVWIFPSDIKNMRAHVQADKVAAPKPPLSRNREIVKLCDILIATPGEFEEQIRSGTWATIRLARKLKKRYFVIYPDGTVSSQHYF